MSVNTSIPFSRLLESVPENQDMKVLLSEYISQPKNAVLTGVAGLIIAFAIHLVYSNYQYNKKYKFPPSVPGPPIVRNSFQLPKYNPGKWALDRAKEHGEMFTLHMGTSTLVFLNTSQTVNELLDKRSTIYSSRRPAPMALDTMSKSNSILFMPHGPTWRAQRKATHSVFNKTNIKSFAPFQDVESKRWLLDVLHQPNEWYSFGKQYSNSVIMGIVFGKRATAGDETLDRLMDLTASITTALLPGSWLVDSMPVLDKIVPGPLKWWKKKGNEIADNAFSLFDELTREALDRHSRGEIRDCFVTQFMKTPEAKEFGWEMCVYLFADMIQGGTDTTYVTSSIIIAAVARHPEAVKRAQEELDAVCGSDPLNLRLPEFSDRPNLPYILAMIKEAIRWRPLLQIGLPHMLTKDDEYKGYRFPAGTLFTWNAWAISFDEKEYEDPNVYKPERFLKEEADIDNVLKGHYSFGPGRRVCAGYNVADTNLWILVARMLYCFDFAEDPNHPIDTVHNTELLRIQESTEEPFKVLVKPRSPAHAALIERYADVAAKGAAY